MKKTFTILFFAFLFSTNVAAQDNGSIQAIKITPEDTTVIVGEEVQFNAEVTDTEGAVVDTSVTWSVVDDVGTVTEDGEFTASAAGSGFVVAQIGDISDSASVIVTAVEEPGAEVVIGSIEITPSNQTLTIVDSIQFQAEVKDTSGAEVDTAVVWSISNTDIGTIDENGLFTAVMAGTTDVIAALGDIADTAVVIVTEEAPPIEPGINNVEFIRVLRNGQSTKFGKSVTEGESKTLGGFPSPLNVLNGSKLEFPENSLVEDITITIKLPEFAVVEDANVTFGDRIVTAATFEVSVNGSVISPYTFETPLVLTLPFKRGLLNNLGIDPIDLGMFFVTPSGELDSTGITDVVVDLSKNTITSTIAHFSDVAVAKKSASSAEIQAIQITPEDTTVIVGEEVQFNAEVTDIEGAVVDTSVTWSVVGDVGTVTEDGIFTASGAGEGYVIIALNSMEDSAYVTVVDTSISGAINTVTIQKILPNGRLHNKIDDVQEGSGEYKFSGFPSPLNILNGGRLTFPVGSVNEDIKITIKLPQIARIEGDTVAEFQSAYLHRGIVHAAEFIVIVDGDTVRPYIFASPVSVSLPYKKGLLYNLGLNPEDLTMAFYSDTAGFDTTGISNVVIDSAMNRIIADVAHFSTLVLYGETETTGTEASDLISKTPNTFMLEQNYPNPFNPETKIVYQIPKAADVTLKIYNILGQEVITLINKEQTLGRYEVIWDGRDNYGNPVSSGIYIYRLHTKDFTKAKRMILLK